MIQEPLREYLAGRPAIASLAAGRVTGGNRTQGTPLPAITISRVSGGHAHNLDGAAGSARPRIQVNCWAGSYAAVWRLADQVRLNLDGFHGRMGAVAVSSAILEDERDVPEPPRPGSQPDTYHVAQDFFIRYETTIPSFV